MTKLSKSQLVFYALQSVGRYGIHSFDLNKVARTFRSAARVYDLKKYGYSIASITERKKNAFGVRYYLLDGLRHRNIPGHWDFTHEKARWVRSK